MALLEKLRQDASPFNVFSAATGPGVSMRVLIPLLTISSLFAQTPPVKAIIGATVVDPGGTRIPDAVVLLKGDRIEKVGPRAKVHIPEGAERVEATGKFLIPGLIDAHVHFFQSGSLYTRPDSFDLRAFKPYAEDQKAIRDGLADTFARYLRCGVTSVADMGGPMWNFDVRELAGKSDRAPRVVVTGPLISSISVPELDLGDPPIIKCATPEEAVALVRREAEKKPAYIKIWYLLTPQEPVEKNRPMVRAAIQESHRLGFRVAVHATELATAKAALEEGADILVHSVDDHEIDEPFLKLAKARNIIYIPTLVVIPGYGRTATQQFAFRPEELAWGEPFALGSLFDVRHLPAGNKMGDRLHKLSDDPKPLPPQPVLATNLMKLHRAGITVAMGTDAGNIGTLHGASVFSEMAAMEAAGLTPMEVLKAATSGGAKVMGHAEDLGRVAPGALADLVLLDADPALSTAALSRISSVIRGGQILDPATLVPESPEALVQRQLNAYNARDLEAFAATYADDVQVVGLDGKVQLRGMTDFKNDYRDMFVKLTKLHCQVVKRIVRGSFVIDEESVTGVRPEPLRAVAIYEIRNGRIAVVRFIQ
jgi:imidazolonepropionase-like amidohydrolase